jgi:hypothetical protein
MDEKIYAENQNSIDKIDLFVVKYSPEIANMIWSKNIAITAENIFSSIVDYVGSNIFDTKPILMLEFWKALYFGVIMRMTLSIDEYPFPIEYYKNTLTE